MGIHTSSPNFLRGYSEENEKVLGKFDWHSIFMEEWGNFKFLIWQKSYQDAAFGPIRGPIGT